MSQINKPTDYFNSVLYTGNGTTNNITVGFQPDLVWIKNRDVGTANHCLMDVVRGFGTGSSDTPLINSNTTDAEFNRDVFSSTGITSTGYELDTYVDTNANTQDFVSWNWLAGGTASSNTDGSITSQVSANTTSGFSVCTFTTSTGSSDTIGHGLGSVPSLIIARPYTSVSSWFVYHQSLGNGSYMRLNNTDAVASSAIWNNTTPTSSVFSLGLGAYGTSKTSIAYCFAEKKGFSKFGSYTGNGSTSGDGAFIYLGFKPAFFIVKNASAAGHSWYMFDNKRDVDNPTNKYLAANSSAADASFDWLDFNSNGIKVRGNSGGANNSGETYIYMAFAESPLVGTNNIPSTAR